jgi:hypothetical protein
VSADTKRGEAFFARIVNVGTKSAERFDKHLNRTVAHTFATVKD